MRRLNNGGRRSVGAGNKPTPVGRPLHQQNLPLPFKVVQVVLKADIRRKHVINSGDEYAKFDEGPGSSLMQEVEWACPRTGPAIGILTSPDLAQYTERHNPRLE